MILIIRGFHLPQQEHHTQPWAAYDIFYVLLIYTVYICSLDDQVPIFCLSKMNRRLSEKQ